MPSYLVDQVASGGGLARVDVANDDNVDVGLFLSHLERFLDPVRLNASERMLALTFKFFSDLKRKLRGLGATNTSQRSSDDEIEDKLNHLLQQLVDLVLAAAKVTT